jgi:hypothetical protein
MKNVAATSQMYNRHVNPLQTIFREIWPYLQNLKPVSLIIYELIHKVVNSITDYNIRLNTKPGTDKFFRSYCERL